MGNILEQGNLVADRLLNQINESVEKKEVIEEAGAIEITNDKDKTIFILKGKDGGYLLKQVTGSKVDKVEITKDVISQVIKELKKK
jgi:hypothetical protein